jgi:hypothetical protein
MRADQRQASLWLACQPESDPKRIRSQFLQNCPRFVQSPRATMRTTSFVGRPAPANHIAVPPIGRNLIRAVVSFFAARR